VPVELPAGPLVARHGSHYVAGVDPVHVLAVDIGGTKLATAVVASDGTVRAGHRSPTPAATDGETLFATLVGLAEASIDDWRQATGLDAGALRTVGVGCGGPMSPFGETVSPLNIPAWRQFPLRARLAERFGRPVHIDNDAKALARAEGWTGAARGQTDYLAMVVSTGVGAGLVVDGRLLDGASGNAGHLGHLVVEPEGRRCACGARGCLEAEASGTALAAMTGRPAAEASPELRRRTGCLVGRAVAGAVHLLDIRLAVVGGSVALGFGEPFFDAANRELAERARLSFAEGARIVPAGLGASGPLVGAAAVALHAEAIPT